MSAKNFTRLVIAAAAVAFVLAGPARADKKQLQEKLNKNISIELDDVTIAEALETIGQKAELKIVVSDEAVWKLPEGKTTRLSVTLEGRLGDSIKEMLSAFFMRYAVGDEQITIYPQPELVHIIGRSGTQQLELLKKIYSLRITFARGFTAELVNSLIGKSMVVSFLPYDIPNKIYEILKTSETDKGTSPTTLAVLLEQIGAEQRRPHWYISGTELPNEVPMIKMVSEQDFRQAKLDQIIDISFVDERADVILQRLAGWAGMELIVFKKETSWLNNEITVNMQNVSITQALLNIVNAVDGTIGIGVDDNSIEIEGPSHPRIQKTAASAKPKNNASTSEGYVGKISIPMDGGKYFLEFMLRENDLTEEFKQLRDEKINEITGKSARIKKLRETLIELEKSEKESETK